MITAWSKQIGAASVLTSSFTYDPADQLIAAAVPSGSATTNYSYGYDPAGNRTREQIDTSVTGSTFNHLNQVTAQSPGGAMEFTGTVNKWATITLAGRAATVDAAGNWRGTANVTVGANSVPLVATDVNGNTTTKTINVAVSGGASRTLTYDLNGNLTNDGAGKTYAYDAVNRLITITQGSNVTTFVYNGLGQRVQEKLNGTVIKQWVWNAGAQPAEERNGSNNVTKRFYGIGEQIGAVAYFFTADHLGSIREMVDSTGLIRARYDYDPYGRITKVSGDLEADFGFTGFYRHQASGLDLTLYRAYDPELGRWLARDPIGERGGFNLHGYVGNNPTNFTDPFGLARHFGESVSACMDRFKQQYYGPYLGVVDELGLWGLVSGAFVSTAGQEALSRTAEKLAERGLESAERDAQIAGAMNGGSIYARFAAANAAGMRVAALRTGLVVVGNVTAAITMGATAFSFGARAMALADCASEEDSPCKKK